MIEAKNLTYVIGDKVILDDVSISVRHGETLAILGPNGAGKSSLFKFLTGTVQPPKGTVTLNERNITDYSIEQLSKKRAVLAQSSTINFPFSAREIVMMGRSPHLLDQECHNDHEVVKDILDRLDAHHLADRLYSTLSGGEQQRIQFARVLAQIWDQDHAYLFLDEPTSALDLKQQLNIVGLAQELSLERGFAVCMIVHDLNLARHYADYILFLKDGVATAYGTPKQVLNAQRISDTFDIPSSYAAKFAHS